MDKKYDSLKENTMLSVLEIELVDIDKEKN